MINQENLKQEGIEVTSSQAQKIDDHYKNPKNNSALTNYNARGVGRNPDNWGQFDLYLQIDDQKILQDLGYEYKGCPTIAFTASVFTEELKGVALDDALKTTQKELDSINAQENCDDCIKMILVAFICAYDNYHERLKGTNNEDYNFSMIDTTIPYTQQSCS